MSISEFQRHQIFQWCEEVMGPERAAIMMDLLPPVGWGDIATRTDLHALRSDLRGEMAGLRAELKDDMAALSTELRSEMASLRAELKDETAGLRVELKDEMAGLRADLRGEMVTQTRWMVSVLTVLATVFTAANVLT